MSMKMSSVMRPKTIKNYCNIYEVYFKIKKRYLKNIRYFISSSCINLVVRLVKYLLGK